MNGGEIAAPRVWRGPAIISVGLVVLGLSSYAYLTIAARALDPPDYARLSALWSLVFALLAGAFSPLEIEGTRAISARLSVSQPVGPAVDQLARVGLAVGLTTMVVLAALAPVLTQILFDGDLAYMGILGATALPFFVIYLVRGVLAGTRRFSIYSILLGGEGVLRAILAAVAVLLGVASGLAIAGALLASAILAALISGSLLMGCGRARRRSNSSLTGKEDVPHGQLAGNLGALLVASLAAQGLINAGPVTAQALGDDAALTGAVLAAFVLVRIPVMFISALQSGFIPLLVLVLKRDDRQEFNRIVVQVLARVGTAGVALTITAGLVGPWVAELFFGSLYALGPLDYTVLMLSSVMFVFAALLQAVLVSLDGHRRVTLAWMAGVAVYTAALAMPVGLLQRIEGASVASMFVVCLGLWLGIRVGRHGHRRVHGTSPSARRQGD